MRFRALSLTTWVRFRAEFSWAGRRGGHGGERTGRDATSPLSRRVEAPVPPPLRSRSCWVQRGSGEGVNEDTRSAEERFPHAPHGSDSRAGGIGALPVRLGAWRTGSLHSARGNEGFNLFPFGGPCHRAWTLRFPGPPPDPPCRCRTPPSRRQRLPAPCAAPAAAMPSLPAPAGTCPPSRMSPKDSWGPRGSPKRRKKGKSSSGRGWKGKETCGGQLRGWEGGIWGWGLLTGCQCSNDMGGPQTRGDPSAVLMAGVRG